MIHLIIPCITLLCLIFLFCREILNFKEIKGFFICDKCGELVPTIYRGCQCDKCKYTFSNRYGEWGHLFGTHYTKIDTDEKSFKYEYKRCIQICKISIAVYSVCMVILMTDIIFIFIGMTS